MKIEFLGVGSCMPEYEQADTASLIVNGHILVDTGWHVVRNLLRSNVKPENITHIFFTHMHQDHYLGLAAFLFYLMNGFHTFGNLKIYGPEGVESIVENALLYGGRDVYYSDIPKPFVHTIASGECVCLDDVKISCVASRHAVDSRAYRMENPETGKSVVYTGDTEPFAALPDFARGSDVLIHEASFDIRQRPEHNPYRHSSCYDAANAAAAAGVKTLYMVHASTVSRESTIAEASKIFPDCRRPVEGDCIEL